MRIRLGKHKGKTGKVHQFANDWVTVTLDNGEHINPLSPLSIQLDTAEEIAQFEQTKGTPNVGTFWKEWVLREDGRFTAIRRRRRQEVNPR